MDTGPHSSVLTNEPGNQADCPEARIRAALALAARYGRTEGGHHKAWVIDQMARILAGDGYAAFVAAVRAGVDGPETHEWDGGVQP